MRRPKKSPLSHSLTSDKAHVMSQPSAEMPLEIDVVAVQALRQADEDFLFVDCREADEHQFVRIAGTLLVPMGETPARLAEFAPWRDRRIVVHCHHGGRSMQVVQWLRQQGFAKAQNMRGGIDAWSCQVDPSLPRY
jgi:rhodanese-related sulfurtransferase